jgi:hypothetical protein
VISQIHLLHDSSLLAFLYASTRPLKESPLIKKPEQAKEQTTAAKPCYDETGIYCEEFYNGISVIDIRQHWLTRALQWSFASFNFPRMASQLPVTKSFIRHRNILPRHRQLNSACLLLYNQSMETQRWSYDRREFSPNCPFALGLPGDNILPGAGGSSKSDPLGPANVDLSFNL